MILPAQYNLPVPEQNATSQTWWQGLFSLGQEAIRRSLPLPGETAGGVPGVPLRPAVDVARESVASTNTFGIPNMFLIVGAVLLAIFALRK